MSVQLVHSRGETADIFLLTVAAVEYRDTTGSAVERDVAEPSDVVDDVTSAAVDSVPEDKRMMPYCKTTDSPECVGDSQVPDAAHTKHSFQ